jgi:hypothetical protein
MPIFTKTHIFIVHFNENIGIILYHIVIETLYDKEDIQMKQSIKVYQLVKILLSEIRKYGISEVSVEQYQVVCNSVLEFFASKEIEIYSDATLDEYTEMVTECCDMIFALNT